MEYDKIKEKLPGIPDSREDELGYSTPKLKNAPESNKMAAQARGSKQNSANYDKGS